VARQDITRVEAGVRRSCVPLCGAVSKERALRDEMDASTWKFGHKNQNILDGTFGICDSRILLFITMVLDDERKRYLAFLL